MVSSLSSSSGLLAVEDYGGFVKAICVNAELELRLREVPTPRDAPKMHLLVNIEAAAINHGDKFFLANFFAMGGQLKDDSDYVWGASAAGSICAVGSDVSADLVGRKVAIYRSLCRSEHTVGVWSEQALVPRLSCVVLPPSLTAADYSGSLVNVITAHAFLEQITTEGHKGVIVTAGASATGLAMAALARRRGVSAIFLCRSAVSAARLRSVGVEHVLITESENFERELSKLAQTLGTTAVFDGVGGKLISRIAPELPANSVIYLYGLLGASAPIAISSLVLLSKNLTLKRYNNFATPTVSDPEKLSAAITYLESIMDDPLFRTRTGKEFPFALITEAMAFEESPGAKAILVPGSGD